MGRTRRTPGWEWGPRVTGDKEPREAWAERGESRGKEWGLPVEPKRGEYLLKRADSNMKGLAGLGPVLHSRDLFAVDSVKRGKPGAERAELIRDDVRARYAVSVCSCGPAKL